MSPRVPALFVQRGSSSVRPFLCCRPVSGFLSLCLFGCVSVCLSLSLSLLGAEAEPLREHSQLNWQLRSDGIPPISNAQCGSRPCYHVHTTAPRIISSTQHRSLVRACSAVTSARLCRFHHAGPKPPWTTLLGLLPGWLLYRGTCSARSTC